MAKPQAAQVPAERVSTGGKRVLFRAGCVFSLALAIASPAVAQSLVTRADLAWTTGNHTLAESLYRSCLAENPRDATALHRLAILSMRHARYEESEGLLDRLLAIAPTDTEAHVTRARLLAARGDLGAARAIVDSILHRHPDDVGAHQADGQFRAWDADLVGAERAWRIAFGLDSANVDTRLGLARTLRHQGRQAAAAEVLRPVAPDDQYDDLVDEFDWIARSLGPRAGSTLIHEDDSDGNAITTLVMTAATRPLPRLEVRADAYLRHADLESGSGQSREARGGTVTMWTQREPGWAVQASAGASTSDSPDAEILPAWSFGVSTPARNRVAAAVSVARTPFDATAITTENRVTVREIAVDARWSPSRSWLLHAVAAGGAFEAGASGRRNGRWRGQAELVRRLNQTFGLVLAGRGFGFADDLDDGYFDPDFYGVLEIGTRLRRERRHWHVEGEIAPGIEKIRLDGEAAGSLRAMAGVTYLLRPGRQVRMTVVYANSGIEKLSPTGGGEYRYASAGIGFLWRF
jgi:tetratricopeptide (TPR) repeat protein